MSISTPPTDPTIDPITGLPILNPSGPVQQIPLGQEVFPYADLNATAQPTRGPIYGDDIIPTSGLVTAPDIQMKPRSIQSTTTRELRVREAVFQNLGAPIPDGTTAPVDVNVVSGGGGGVTSATYRTNANQVVGTLCSAGSRVFLDDLIGATTIYGVTWWAVLDPDSTPSLSNVAFHVYLAPSTQLSHHVFCGFGGWSIVAAGVTADLMGDSKTILFPVPINRALTWPGAADVSLVLEAANGDIFCGGSGITG